MSILNKAVEDIKYVEDRLFELELVAILTSVRLSLQELEESAKEEATDEV